jgi:hypothetical protein
MVAWADAPLGSRRFTLEWLAFKQPGNHAASTLLPPIAEVLALPGRVTALANSANQMTSVAQALNRKGHEVLSHLSWAAVVPPNGRTTATLRDLLPSPSSVSGAIAIQRGQHLFLNVEVDYQSAAGVTCGVREHRRIKFNEYHYFDHPAFGVIMQVRPPKNDAESDE